MVNPYNTTSYVNELAEGKQSKK